MSGSSNQSTAVPHRAVVWAATAAVAGYCAVLIYQLSAQWSAYEQYGYGWAVPVLCVYLFSQRWADRPPGEAPLSWRGVWIAAGLLLLLWAPARLLHEANPIWRLTSLSLALVFVGLSMCLLYAIGGMSWVRHFGFPVAFLMVAVPWPSGIENPITQGLMRSNVRATIELVGLLGIPALQRGNVIEIGLGLVGVNEACSGIRSLQASIMISLFFGELYRMASGRRLGLVFTGIGLAMLFNIGRTVLLTVIAARQGPAAIDRWHDPAGTVILVGCFVGILLASHWLKKARIETTKITTDGLTTTREFSALAQGHHSALRVFAGVLGAWLVLVEGGVELWYRSHEQTPASVNSWAVEWPKDRPGFMAKPIAPVTQAILRYDNGSGGAWSEADGSVWQGYYLHWLSGRSVYQRTRIQLAKTHDPESCLTAAGMRLSTELGTVVVETKSGVRLPMKKYHFDHDGRSLYVFFAAVEDLREAASGGYFKKDSHARLDAVLNGSRNYGYRTLELAVWGISDPVEAETAVRAQLEKLIRVVK